MQKPPPASLRQNDENTSVYELSLEGVFKGGNRALEALSGYSQEQLIGTHFEHFIAPEAIDRTRVNFDATISGQTLTFETRGITAAGHEIDLEVTNFPLEESEQVVGVWGICRDVTGRKQDLNQLNLLKRSLEADPNGITIVDAKETDMPIVFVNPAFTAITGYSASDILGKNCRFLQGRDTDASAVGQIKQGLQQARCVDVSLINYRKDGTPFWNRLLINPVFDSNGECSHFIAIQQDITRHKEREARIAYQATHDSLTGLPNRTTFSDCVKQLFYNCESRQCPLAFFYLDLDGFKSINDGLGYHIGNKVLAQVAERIRALLQPKVIVGRLVADEFGILLHDYQSSDEVIALANQILESLVVPFEVGDLGLHLSGSIGITTLDEHLHQPFELMQRAHIALNSAKARGKNTWQWYQSRDLRATRESVLLRNEVHKALQQQQFVLHYQPIIDSLTGETRNVEALVRWTHPQRGLVPPGGFIPLAEQTGQIVPLGQWVLKKACHEIATFNRKTGRNICVAVNISSLQFLREEFLANVDEALEDSRLAPECLELEVTESVILEDSSAAIVLMHALNERGIRLALDDFGTGFSSLSYLRDLPAQKVKLDRSFINKTLTDRRTAAIVQGVITMAHHMDMVVVAEGIETEEEQADLVRRKCDFLQGYRFSKPVPMEVFAGLPERFTAM